MNKGELDWIAMFVLKNCSTLAAYERDGVRNGRAAGRPVRANEPGALIAPEKINRKAGLHAQHDFLRGNSDLTESIGICRL
jgi:hypothetical protein